MNQYPGLEVRGTRYYLRVRIPADLTKIIGRKFLWKSLDTGNRREAMGRAGYRITRQLNPEKVAGDRLTTFLYRAEQLSA
jgi:hypothetical protein